MADHSTSPARRYGRLILLVVLIALVLGLLATRACSYRGDRGQAGAVAKSEAAVRAPSTSPASPRDDTAVPSSAGDAFGSDPAAAHLRAFTFMMDRSGVRLQQTVTAPGRVKAPPRSVATDRLEFEVYDASGATLYAGSLDHPLHRVHEFEDPASAKNLRRVAQEVPEEAFQVRLPASLAATRIAFFEVRGQSRTPFATVTLP